MIEAEWERQESKDDMTLEEFMEVITKEMKEHKFNNYVVHFNTNSCLGLYYLSIYPDNNPKRKVIHIDIGTDEE